MITQDTGRMRPLYEAMSVCSATIEWLEDRELDSSYFELQSNLAKLSQSLEEFVELARHNPLARASRDAITGFGFCVATLNTMTQLLCNQTRQRIGAIPHESQSIIRGLLDQIDHLSERIEDIVEAWQLATNEEVGRVIDSALQRIDKSKTDIPDWRCEIELIAD